MADPSNTALGINPNGDPPDFAHGESLQTVILGLGVTLITVSSVFVIIRLGNSLWTYHKLFLEDCECCHCS